MRNFINILPILFLFVACAVEYSDIEIESIAEQKSFDALICDSDSEIIQVSIDKINSTVQDNGETYVNFYGTYVGKRGMKYEGKIIGEMVLGDTEELKKLAYENSLYKGDIKNTCLNY